MKNLKILCFGDIIGSVGCILFQKHASKLKRKHKAHAIIVNGENAASNGRGITSRIVASFKHNEADVITTGNHIFQKKEIYRELAERKDLLRPANFPSECPGTGVTTFEVKGVKVGVINVQGRIFMRQTISCPFKAVESALTFLKNKTKIVIVDMHAETTSEKRGLANYFDGKVSAIVGTHTHVQTADEQILPGGTAFISDLGMSGSSNSIIGMKSDIILYNMITQMPIKFEVETIPPYICAGAILKIDVKTGKAVGIERFHIKEEA